MPRIDDDDCNAIISLSAICCCYLLLSNDDDINNCSSSVMKFCGGTLLVGGVLGAAIGITGAIIFTGALVNTLTESVGVIAAKIISAFIDLFVIAAFTVSGAVVSSIVPFLCCCCLLSSDESARNEKHCMGLC